MMKKKMTPILINVDGNERRVPGAVGAYVEVPLILDKIHHGKWSEFGDLDMYNPDKIPGPPWEWSFRKDINKFKPPSWVDALCRVVYVLDGDESMKRGVMTYREDRIVWPRQFYYEDC